MCKNAYEQYSAHTGKIMIFCNHIKNQEALTQLCISQKFCPKKDRYIELNPKETCKHYN